MPNFRDPIGFLLKSANVLLVGEQMLVQNFQRDRSAIATITSEMYRGRASHSKLTDEVVVTDGLHERKITL